MTKFESTRHGKLIASQMLDVTIRVKDVRPFSVKQMVCITLAMYSVMLVIVYDIAYGILYIMCIIRVFHYLLVFYIFILLFSIYLVIFLCISCRPIYWRTVTCSLVKYRRKEYVKCYMLQPGL